MEKVVRKTQIVSSEDTSSLCWRTFCGARLLVQVYSLQGQKLDSAIPVHDLHRYVVFKMEHPMLIHEALRDSSCYLNKLIDVIIKNQFYRLITFNEEHRGSMPDHHLCTHNFISDVHQSSFSYHHHLWLNVFDHYEEVRKSLVTKK